MLRWFLVMDKTFYITTPIYYANGRPHIGHAFTTLYADVIARYKRKNGFNVFFTTGLDEHGSKIVQTAQRKGETPQAFVDKIFVYFKELWKILNIKCDDFIRTTSKRHEKGVLEFVKKLYDAGDIYLDFYEGYYCVGCESFITEKNLVNGLCPDHKKPPLKIKEKNYFFNLKKYLPELKEKIKNNELKIIPETRKNEILSIIDSKIPDFSISREKVKWGISFPYDKNQTIYVWVDALSNYLTVLGYPDGEKFKKYWPADVHIIGAEINKFHSIFWPAMLLSAKLPLPKTIFVHGLFTINGQKMSKSLGNIIDPLKLIEKFGTDGVRYLLLSQFSAFDHGDIKESEFSKKYNNDLANGIGNLLERTFTMIVNYKNGGIKENDLIDKKIEKFIKDIEKKYHQFMDNFQLFEALREIFVLVKNLDRYIEEKKPWEMARKKEEGKELDMVLASLFFGIENILEWLEPFIPSKIEMSKGYISKIKNKKIKKGERLNLFPRI